MSHMPIPATSCPLTSSSSSSSLSRRPCPCPCPYRNPRRKSQHHRVDAVGRSPRPEEIRGVSKEARDEEVDAHARAGAAHGEKGELREARGSVEHPPPGQARADAAEDHRNPAGSAEVRQQRAHGESRRAQYPARGAHGRERRHHAGAARLMNRTDPPTAPPSRTACAKPTCSEAARTNRRRRAPVWPPPVGDGWRRIGTSRTTRTPSAPPGSAPRGQGRHPLGTSSGCAGWT